MYYEREWAVRFFITSLDKHLIYHLNHEFLSKESLRLVLIKNLKEFYHIVWNVAFLKPPINRPPTTEYLPTEQSTNDQRPSANLQPTKCIDHGSKRNLRTRNSITNFKIILIKRCKVVFSIYYWERE